MSFVLAIEPDSRQAAILKRVIRDKVRAEFVQVDSRDAAMAAIRARIPDVILVTALMSPRDEEELVTFLRSLAGGEHVQTHTIPQLAASAEDLEETNGSGGLFGFLRKKEPPPPVVSGCDPELFASEIRDFVARASEHKAEYASTPDRRLRILAPREYASQRDDVTYFSPDRIDWAVGNHDVTCIANFYGKRSEPMENLYLLLG